MRLKFSIHVVIFSASPYIGVIVQARHIIFHAPLQTLDEDAVSHMRT